MEPNSQRSSRRPLTKERVLEAAIDLADRNGLDALTMRRLGSELGVEAMSLYKHVENKDAILDGIVEQVIGEIETPTPESEWKDAMRQRAQSARDVLSRHSWAIGLLEARGSTGPNTMRYVNDIIGNLRSAGFSIEDAVHAFLLLDSYVYGHVIQETSTSMSPSANDPESTGFEVDEDGFDEFPHLLELVAHASKHEYTFEGEFEFGLELILDALEGVKEKR